MNAFDFIKTLRKNDILHDFLAFLECGEGEFLPKSVNIEDLNENSNDSILANLLSDILMHNKKSEVEGSVVDKILEIGCLYSQAVEIFHVKLEKYDPSIDMGDDLFDIFVPLLSEQFEKAILSQ